MRSTAFSLGRPLPRVRVTAAPACLQLCPAVIAKQGILLDLRAAARKAKNWAESDRLRDEIAAKGWRVKDSKDGQTVEKEVGNGR